MTRENIFFLFIFVGAFCAVVLGLVGFLWPLSGIENQAVLESLR